MNTPTSKKLKTGDNMGYFKNFGAWLSAGGNVLSGGHFQVPISARVGYMSHHTEEKSWKKMERIIDFTFLPIDGTRHCYRSYLRDPNENFLLSNEKKRSFAVMAGIACLFCAILIPFTWTYQLIKS